MQSTTLIIPVAFAAALLAFAGSDSTGKAQPKKAVAISKTAKSFTAPKTAASKGVASKGVASKGVASKTNVSLTKKPSAKTTTKPTANRYSRSSQVQPSSERYKEIQQALSEKGYFGGSADGNWGPESMDALKRFQHDQNITEDGKISSLSIIALGLGPKREPPTLTPQGSGVQ